MELNLSVYEKEPKSAAQACIIWMHGLGSDAQNMMGIAEAFPNEPAIKHVFLDAPVRPVAINNNMPMRAWYNIMGVKLTDREDKPGILESSKMIEDVVNAQLAKGFKPQQIFLAGFSQGGAMSLYTGLNLNIQLGGIIALSAYIPLATEITSPKNNSTPIFLGLGEQDPIVLPAWTMASYNWLQTQNFANLTLQKYPMEHNICIEEIRDLYNWLNIQISHDITENTK